MLASIILFGLGIFWFIAVIALAILVFEVVMFVHVLRNSNISDERRILWAVGMLLIHPFVAIAYLLTDYRA